LAEAKKIGGDCNWLFSMFYWLLFVDISGFVGIIKLIQNQIAKFKVVESAIYPRREVGTG
jgi:hypothetical protein